MIYKNDFLFLLQDLHNNYPCNVTKFLLLNETKSYDFTYIGIQDDMVTFIPVKKIEKGYKQLCDKHPDEYIPHHDFQRTFSKDYKNPVSIKIGRFLRKVNNFTDAEIQNFTNNFKGYLKFKTDTSRFELISGEDIRKYYLDSSYEYKKGHLGQSCMRHAKCQPFLDIYTSNTDICKLLILRGYNTDKIAGRALIWTLDTGELYLDRVYCVLDSDMKFFEEYAKSLGCKWSYDKIYDENNPKFIELKIKPKNQVFDFYPFMDTFRYYYPKKKIFNSEIIVGNNNYHVLESGDGELPMMVSKKILLNKTILATSQIINNISI